MFKANMLKNREALQAEKSATMIFNQAMLKFQLFEFEESFPFFERAAAKGHEVAIWIVNVMKNAKIEQRSMKGAFARAEEPLGCFLAGWLSLGREQFEFFKKSAEGGCSWGQAEYGWYFKYSLKFVCQDKKAFLDWLEKAANQNNPLAMSLLGDWFRDDGDDKEKALSYYRASAELGWINSIQPLAEMLKDRARSTKDTRQVMLWCAKMESVIFWYVLLDAKEVLENNQRMEDLFCNFSQLYYTLGWGLYWYQYGSKEQKLQNNGVVSFGKHCLDYYCLCVESQQKSIFTFLLCWNQTTGIKGPGQLIAQLVWEEREDNLVKEFEWKQEGWECILF
jgi:hypothetical protein